MIKLMHGNCLELMQAIPDESVDMVLCDLPYGMTRNRWDVVIPFEQMWAAYHRICKPNAAIVLFGALPFGARLIMSNPREFRYEWIYEKTNPTGFLNAKKMPMRYHENIMVFYRKLPRYNPIMQEGHERYKRTKVGEKTTTNYGAFKRVCNASQDGTRYPSDIIRYSNTSWGNDAGLHPTQKPVELLAYLIKTYTIMGETVMDNCMGSGSTGVACVLTGRRFVGIELDQYYFEAAKRRIDEAVMHNCMTDTGGDEA